MRSAPRAVRSGSLWLTAFLLLGFSVGPVAARDDADAAQGGVEPGPDARPAVEVRDVTFGPARLGDNPFRVRVRNSSDVPVLALLDLRAVPGMWMLPNMQAQFTRELEAGEEGVIEGSFEFRRLSPEATLRVMVGPGAPQEGGNIWFSRVDFRETYSVGAESPDAYDPDRYFVRARSGPLEIFAWRGSLAERHLGHLATERLEAVSAVEELLAVRAPEPIRLVFYSDEETKIEQTGHRGLGWARGRTLVEVYNQQVQLDPYHELAHVVAERVGSPPPILSEGFAIFASEKLGADALRFLDHPGQPADRVVCDLQGGSRYIPLEELLGVDNIGSDASRAGREYAEAGSFVSFLVESHGLERLREAYESLEAHGDFAHNRARLERIYGRTLENLEDAWLASIADLCPDP